MPRPALHALTLTALGLTALMISATTAPGGGRSTASSASVRSTAGAAQEQGPPGAVLAQLPAPTRADAAVSLLVPLDGRSRRLELEPASLRAPGFRLRVERADGSLKEIDAPASKVWTGTVAGRPDSRASVAWTTEGWRGSVAVPGEGLWHLEPGAAAAGGRVRRSGKPHLVYRHDEIDPAIDGTCASEALPALPAAAQDPEGGAAGFAGSGASTALIAIDADYEFYQLNGSSVSATVADIEALMAGVSAIYAAEVGIDFRISEIIVRTGTADPYSENAASTLLTQFRNYWNANHWDVPRDAAHLMTGRDLDGTTIGVAWVGVVCTSSSNAYGLSQSRYTGNFGLRVSLTAHELGHNWGADHCASACSGTPGDADCAIMCPCNGGCSNDTTVFGTSATAQILDHLADASCDGEILGGCCLSDGECIDFVGAAQCTSFYGGTFLGSGLFCGDAACSVACPADITGDGLVNVDDLVAVITAWGMASSTADIDDDGVVDTDDLVAVISEWGGC